MYLQGNGVRQDYAAVAKWSRKAAEQGEAIAQANLGAMYLEGKGVPQDYAEVAKWSRMAAEQGNAIAQSILGMIHSEGLGVTKDYVEAYMWVTLSVAGSTDKQSPFFQQTADLRASIAKKMNPQQIAEAQRRAKEWKPKKAK